MLRLVARCTQGVAVVLLASSIAFFLMKFAKGDPFPTAGESASYNEAVHAYRRAQMGLDEPLPVQYGRWLGSIARGDFGISNQPGNRKVSRIILDALPITVVLMSLALIASAIAGIALGAWQGAHAKSRWERATNALGVVLYAVPEFWLATILVFVFALRLPIFPVEGVSEPGATYGTTRSILDVAWHLFLPWLSLTLVGTAIFARYQQAAMRDVLSEMFVRTARAKGVSESAVLRQHALRVAILPVITIGGLFFPALLTGAVLIETVFSRPGLGRVLTAAVSNRDYYVVTGVVIVGSAMTAVGTFLADILREKYDPRLRDQ
ncbi:MAG: ABC transporter permease [Gemmatimonadaceae bacterium]